MAVPTAFGAKIDGTTAIGVAPNKGSLTVKPFTVVLPVLVTVKL